MVIDRFSRLGIIFFLGLFLTSCISVRNPTPQRHFIQLSRQARERILSRLTAWRNDGAFSIQYQHKKPVLANFSWSQFKNNRSRIQIDSVLDLYSILILTRPGSVVLWKNQQQHYKASSAQVLMQRILGWSLPIENMTDWIKGLAAPGRSQKNYDAFGHLVFLRQQGWSIRYASYKTVDGVDLPNVIYLTRSGLSMKIVIKHWFLQ